MSFGIGVYRRTDDKLFNSPPEDVNSGMFDEWFEVCRDRTLYENPLGADGDIYEFWSKPASQLGLTKLKQIYNEGLRVLGSEIGDFASELATLERYWESQRMDLAKLSGLKERMRALHEALEIARRHDGVVNIS